MAEFRRDPIVGQWVIVETEKSYGLEKYKKEARLPRLAERCQFCPGKEHLTPPEVDAIRDNGAPANGPGWKVRVIPNKFPALKIEGDIQKRTDGILECSNGIGAHEVLIETNDHSRDLADLSVNEISDMLLKYQSRVVDLTGDKRFKYIIIFKNYGQFAGATVEHAHSQIIALPMIPKYVLQELEGTKYYYEKYKRCVYCDIIKQELEEQERIVTQNDDFLTFSPFVPRYPFECWIIPKRHESDFATLTSTARQSLAVILKETLMRIKLTLTDPSYNYYLHIAPVNQAEPTQYHWHIEIVPKMQDMTGFEWGTGFYVVRTDPKVAARYLRAVKVA